MVQRNEFGIIMCVIRRKFYLLKIQMANASYYKRGSGFNLGLNAIWETLVIIAARREGGRAGKER